jgi:hypothetical protein
MRNFIGERSAGNRHATFDVAGAGNTSGKMVRQRSTLQEKLNKYSEVGLKKTNVKILLSINIKTISSS